MIHRKQQRRLLCESLERRQLFSVDLDFGARDFHGHESNERFEVSREVRQYSQSTQWFASSNIGSFRREFDAQSAVSIYSHRPLEPLTFSALQPSGALPMNIISQSPPAVASASNTLPKLDSSIDNFGSSSPSSANGSMSSAPGLNNTKLDFDDLYAPSTPSAYRPVVVIVGITVSPVTNLSPAISINSLLNSRNSTNVEMAGTLLTNSPRTNNIGALANETKTSAAWINVVSANQSAVANSLDVSHRIINLESVRSLSLPRVQLFVLGPDDVEAGSQPLSTLDASTLTEFQLSDLLKAESFALDDVHLLDEESPSRWQISTDTLRQLRALSTTSAELMVAAETADTVPEALFTGSTGLIEVAYRQTPIARDGMSTSVASDGYELHSQLGLFRLLVVLGDNAEDAAAETAIAAGPAIPTLTAIENSALPIDISGIDDAPEPADVPRKSSIFLTSLLAVFTGKALWQRRDRNEKGTLRNQQFAGLRDKSRSE